jgi:hypothetical protein
MRFPRRLVKALAFAVALAATSPAHALNRIDEIGPHILACLRKHPIHSETAWSATLRFSMRRDGTLLGAPRVTHSRPAAASPGGGKTGEELKRALTGCMPLPLSPSLGGAIAGRPLLLIVTGAGRSFAGEARIHHPVLRRHARFGSPLERVVPGEKRTLVPGSRVRPKLFGDKPPPPPGSL